MFSNLASIINFYRDSHLWHFLISYNAINVLHIYPPPHHHSSTFRYSLQLKLLHSAHPIFCILQCTQCISFLRGFAKSLIPHFSFPIAGESYATLSKLGLLKYDNMRYFACRQRIKMIDFLDFFLNNYEYYLG